VGSRELDSLLQGLRESGHARKTLERIFGQGPQYDFLYRDRQFRQRSAQAGGRA